MPSNYKFIKTNINNKNKKPKRVKVDVQKLLKLRDVRLVIRASALLLKQIVIHYTKVNGVSKDYTICPMSYRYRRLRQGLRKVLFAWDTKDKALKMFVGKNIKNAKATLKPYVPIRYPIEIE